MKLIYLIIFCVIIAHCSSTKTILQKYPVNYQRGILNLFTEIQAQIKAGNPLSSIFDILDDEKSAILDEQAQHTLLHNAQQEQCTQEISFRTSEVNDANSALMTANGQLDRCNQNLESALTTLDSAKENLNNAQINLGNLQDYRQQQIAIYNQRVQDYNDAIDAVDQCIEYIDEILTGKSSFLQLAKVSSKMLKHAVKLRKTNLYDGVIAILAQMSSKQVITDQAALEKIISLLKTLKNNLDNSNQDYVLQEGADREEFENKVAAFQNIINQSNQQIDDFNGEIEQDQQCIIQYSQIIDEAQSKYNRNSQLLGDCQNMCDNADKSFEAQTQSRNEELQLIDQIREIINQRFAQLSEQVYQRGIESADQWEAYKNQYQVNPTAFLQELQNQKSH